MQPGQAYPEQYTSLLQEKCARLQKRFSVLADITAEIVPSQPEAYRLRAEFRIWHDNNRANYSMMAPGKVKTPLLIENFPIGSTRIQQLMPLLLVQINKNETLKKNLFQAEFLTSLSGEAIITLIYHRTLDEAWQKTANQLKQDLASALSIPELHIIGRSRGQKICLDRDFIFDNFTVNNISYTYQQFEGSFIQPNGWVNEKMLDWASKVTRGNSGDLLELYCGNGNFTLPLAKNFRRVLATEVSKTAIGAALHNLATNKTRNVDIARLSSGEATQAIKRVRPFRRLQHLNLDSYHFSTVFVDPPRAGLDEQTLTLIRDFNTICYISCNPDSLLANLEQLKQTHRVSQLAFFDQFPYTDHMECGVLLTQ